MAGQSTFYKSLYRFPNFLLEAVLLPSLDPTERWSLICLSLIDKFPTRSSSEVIRVYADGVEPCNQ